MSFYSCRTIDYGYRVAKFDELYNVEAVYDLAEKDGIVTCTCFQARKPSCRHREMVEQFIFSGKIDQGWFWDWDNSRWLEPIRFFQANEPSKIPLINDLGAI